MHEVDFWNVSTSNKSSDAISMRFVDPSTGSAVVVVIDAGYGEFGDGFPAKLQTAYGTTVVDLAISTHPDADHINGFTGLVKHCAVRELLVHQPRSRGFVSADVACDTVDSLVALAAANGTSVVEPTPGLQRFGGALTILGPTEDFYVEMLQAQMGDVARTSSQQSMKAVKSALSKIADKVRNAIGYEPAETLSDDHGGTHPRNNTSVVTYLHVDGHGHLFTGDAGVPALNKALDAGLDWGIESVPLGFVQIPHHGSRHNVDRALLDRLLGPPGSRDPESVHAFVSASEDDPHHPHPSVLNAFKRRGCFIVPTEGTDKLHGGERAGYTAVEQQPWYAENETS